MKPKKRIRARAPKDGGRSARARAVEVDAGAGGRAVILDFVLFRIENFIRKQGGGVSVRLERTGYTLYRDDTGAPFARLRPRSAKCRYEVLYFARETQRWRSASPYPGSYLTLDDALEFIASDPLDCFWS